MAARPNMDQAQPGDTLLVIHEFNARSPDELSLKRGDRIELIERDDDFGDGWFLGRHLQNGHTGLFPEVYTQLAPRPTFPSVLNNRPGVAYTTSPTLTTGPSFATLDAARPPDSDQPQSTPPQSDSPTSAPSTGIQRSATAPMALSAIATMNNGQRVFSGEQRSPVMNETLSVIDEHLTDINTPRGSMLRDLRTNNDSGSEYSSHVEHRLSYINGQETDEEENGLHTLHEIRHWTPLHVAEWLEDVGVDRRHCEVFKEQEISGEVLLGMDQASVFMKEFDLGPIGPRLKIWQKIKALQQEVAEAVRNSQSMQDYSGSEQGSNAGSIRHRSTSIGTVLPRIPSLMDSNGARPSSRQQVNRGSSQQSVPGTPGSPLNDTRRPSAASVREMNHHRRHSSVEFANLPTTPTTPSNVHVTQATPNAHKKQPSFDRNWKMGDANGRPASSAQMRPETPTEGSPRGAGLNVVTPDLDRGYFSGGEVENRKHRNVLRKGHSPSHSRTSSSGNDGRRLSAFKRHSRIGSSDSMRDTSEPTALLSSFYSPGTKRSQSARTASGPELRSSPKAISKERSATVTKLDYGTPSIDAIASSPNLAEAEETTAGGRASPPPAIQRYPKPRATGLRAISDALAGTLSGTKNPPPVSPNKDSAMNSPARTGSSTPSQTSKSFDSGEAPPDVLRSTTGNSMTSSTASSGPKKKTKKETSAYQRGLENKPPSETIPGSDYNGWMKKRSSNMMTTWKTRLFVLKGRRLSYYYSEFDTAEKGLIDISGHRVLPANNERMTGLHAMVTGAKSSPTSPQNATLTTSAQTDAANGLDLKEDPSGMFIFKLVPPRAGLSKAVNFTKPTVHYFAVDNLQQGRLWMAALMKATIDRDESKEVISTYQQKTISLAKAREMQQRPPALMGEDEDEENVNPDKIDEEDEERGLAISGLEDEGDSADDPKRSGSVGTSEAAAASVNSEAASKE